MILGSQPDGSVGLRIAKPGGDAGQSPPVAANLIFDADWPAMLPIYTKGVFGAGRNQAQTVNFAQLPYVPLFSVMIRSSDGSGSGEGFSSSWTVNQQFSTQYYGGGTVTPIDYFQIWATNSSINFYFGNPSGQAGASPNYLQVAYMIYKLGVSL